MSCSTDRLAGNCQYPPDRALVRDEFTFRVAPLSLVKNAVAPREIVDGTEPRDLENLCWCFVILQSYDQSDTRIELELPDHREPGRRESWNWICWSLA